MNIRFYLVAIVLVLLLTGCGAAAGDVPVILAQSPIATPISSSITPVNESLLTASPSGKVRTGEVIILTTIATADTQLPVGLFFRTAITGSKFYGAARLDSGQVALYEIDLKTGLTQQLGGTRKGMGDIRTSGQYIVWDQDSDSNGYIEIHAYNQQTSQESVLATHARWPDVSGNIVVWDGVIGYDLTKSAPIQVQNLHGEPRYPRISGQWVVYLDAYDDNTADVYAHNLTTNEDFKIGVMPTQGQRIGIVDWYPVISGKNIVWVSAQDDRLHHYNLDTRADRLLPIPLTPETVNGIPRGFEIDGDILIYELRGWSGYDLASEVAFPIPMISPRQNPSKRTSSTPPLVSSGRLIWQTSIDGETHIYTTEIVQDK